MSSRAVQWCISILRGLVQPLAAAAEWTGIDWFLLVFGKEPFTLEPDPLMESTHLPERIEQINAAESVELALRVSEALHEGESERTIRVESKALQLIGSVGLPSGIVLGAFGFVMQSGLTLPGNLFTALFSLFSASAIALLWAVFLALRVVVVASAPTSFPDPRDVFKLATEDTVSWKKHRVSDLLVAYSMNVHRTNRKATYLIGAQVWFRNAVALLLVLAVLASVTIPILA